MGPKGPMVKTTRKGGGKGEVWACQGITAPRLGRAQMGPVGLGSVSKVSPANKRWGAPPPSRPCPARKRGLSNPEKSVFFLPAANFNSEAVFSALPQATELPFGSLVDNRTGHPVA